MVGPATATTRRRPHHHVPSISLPSGRDDDEEEKKDDFDNNCGTLSGASSSPTKTKVNSQKQRQHHEDRRQRLNRNQQARRRRKGHDNDPPFFMLVVQVGTTLLVICLLVYHAYRWVHPSAPHNGSSNYKYEAVIATYDDDGDNNQQGNNDVNPNDNSPQQAHNQDQQQQQQIIQTDPPKPTAPPLPVFKLSDASQWDFQGILDQISTTTTKDGDPTPHLKEEGKGERSESFWLAAQGLRDRFVAKYGGENAARMLMDKGTTTFRIQQQKDSGHTDSPHPPPPADVVATACRLYQARRVKRPFRMAFGGYSVTTGRGNRFQDSYPLQLQGLLETIVKMAGIPDLQVHNAAIGGCPSFPYGWCMTNFWGGPGTSFPHVPDVVNWDYSMNEPNGSPEGLEAYVRHLLSTYHPHLPPKLIVKDHSTARHRKELLADYATLLQDAVAVHTDKIVQPFLAREEEFRPPGFQRWREWGAPPGAPGQALHHPAVQEHALNAWILTMHFLTALEYMMANLDRLESDIGGICPVAADEKASSHRFLPPPVSGKILNNTNYEYNSILFGKRLDENRWIMNPVKCRTTFRPIRSGDLTEVVVSGTIGEDLDVTLPKSQMYYNRGWTLDLSVAERAAKRRLGLYPDGLGFVDSKEAYYGIYESPKMKLLLPFDTTSDVTSEAPQIGDAASDWYDSVVICQVNEKSLEPNDCNLETDIGVIIGGVNATAASTTANATTISSLPTSKMIRTIGSLYLGKPVCKHVSVPAGAKLTSHNYLLVGSGHSKYHNEDDRLLEEDQVGLLVEILVTNPHTVHVTQACSISHVIWEEARPMHLT